MSLISMLQQFDFWSLSAEGAPDATVALGIPCRR